MAYGLPRVDNIQGELLKYGEEDIEILHDICNKIIKTGIWPEDWTTPILIPIPKKVSLKCAIALISHASKGELHQLWSLCWMIVWQVLEQEEVQRSK